MTQTILITGGAGFVGSNIAAALAARATHRIVICDTLGTRDKWRNLRNHAIYEVVPPGNLFYWLEMYGETLDAIVHMGAVSSGGETNVDLLLENNQTSSTLLFRWCAENEKRFIYASSSAVYGDGARWFDDDGSLAYLNTLRPLTPYGWSKLLVDRYIASALEQGEPAPPQWAGLRFFDTYGPNEYHKEDQRSVACTGFAEVKEGKPVRLLKSYRPEFQSGGQKRDFTYVKDCAKVALWLLDNPGVSGLFNVGTGKSRTFDEMARALCAALGKEPKIDFIDLPEPQRSSYQYVTEASIKKLRGAGYDAAFTSLEDGVGDYVRNHLLKDDPYL